MSRDSRAYVSLYLYGDELVPEHITDILKIVPDRAFRKGEKKPSRLQTSTAIARTSLWMVRADPTVGYISEQLDNLLTRIEASWPSSLTALPAVTDAKLDVYVQATLKSSLSFEISRELLEDLSARDLRVSVTLHAVEDE